MTYMPMRNLLAVYDCPKCLEVLEDQVYFDGDETSLCMACGNPVKRRTVEVDGRQIPIVKQVDHKRWMEARGTYSDEGLLE